MILLALLAATTAPPTSPQAFMQRLYAQYRNADFSPFTHIDRVFAPQLIAAIKEDERLAHGEVGYLDGDPVCQCQDPAGMHPAVAGVTPHGRNAAIVRVSIGWDHDKPRDARFTLVRTGSGWRIADVGSADEPSLLAALDRSNREARKRR